MRVLAQGSISADCTSARVAGVLSAKSEEPNATPAGVVYGPVTVDVVRSPVTDFNARPVRYCGVRVQISGSDIPGFDIDGTISIEESIDSVGRTAKVSLVGPLWGISF